jgi:hypothetical protein
MLGYPAEAECLRHFTTARSKRSLYQRNSQGSGNRKYLELLFHVDTGYWREELQDEYEASECDLLIID